MNAIVLGGDCLQVLRDIESDSVHAVVTDPPYGLSNLDADKLTTALTAWVNGDRERVPSGKGFMGKEWDAFVPPPAVWDECMRVLKPGGHMLVFAGSRTVDLMGLSIRLAGFEIRDTLQWLYGSGFPKSMDVSKSLDKLAGAQRDTERIRYTGNALLRSGGANTRPWMEKALEVGYHERPGSVPATDAAREWEGWGTALKPAAEPIILARKPLESTVARNVLAHSVGGLNIDGCRVATDDDRSRPPRTPNELYGSGRGTNLTASESHDAGRFPANVILSHTETCDTETCEHGCPVAELDAQSDNTSRFFPTFRYQAKAPKRERPKVDGVSHPTVKPVALMRWLVRLVTPPGGTVLDPFAGSGTTLQAASEEGFASIGVERDGDYLKLINSRLGFEDAA